MFPTWSRLLVLSLACVLALPAAGEESQEGQPSRTPASRVSGIEELGSEAAGDIREHPQAWFWSLRRVLAEPPELLRLVNHSHGLGENYEPANLVELSETYAHIETAGRQHVSARTADALSRMVRAARTDGVELVVSSAYRSYTRQKALHAHWIDELGESRAKAVSAPPGHSQHQLGTTVDFAPVDRAFEDTAADRWLRDNAWRYGFSLSYPEGYEELTGYNHESWHYRYIGTAATYLERRYFDGVQQRMLEYLHERREELEQWARQDFGEPALLR
ncbi:MAG: M15 family metallopeptidase [Spirochaetales bacterium]